MRRRPPEAGRSVQIDLDPDLCVDARSLRERPGEHVSGHARVIGDLEVDRCQGRLSCGWLSERHLDREDAAGHEGVCVSLHPFPLCWRAGFLREAGIAGGRGHLVGQDETPFVVPVGGRLVGQVEPMTMMVSLAELERRWTASVQGSAVCQVAPQPATANQAARTRATILRRVMSHKGSRVLSGRFSTGRRPASVKMGDTGPTPDETALVSIEREFDSEVEFRMHTPLVAVCGARAVPSDLESLR